MIKQPNNVKSKDGSLTFDSRFAINRNAQMKRKQQFIDSECMRKMEPYTPFLSGVLARSATLHTKIGSGLIIQKTPYARRQYYNQYSNYSNNSTGLRGSKWFERMKAKHKKEILEGADKL